MEPVRLQKYIAELGLASRREVETWIKEKRLTVNGTIAELGLQITDQKASILLDGKPLSRNKPPKVYWLLHKPDKYLVSKAKDGEKERIFDLPKLKKVPFTVFPVGRLDYRTEGLLLITNDGELCHRLTHPSFKLPRLYQVIVSKKLTKEQERVISKGVPLEDGVARCSLTDASGMNLPKARGHLYFVTVHEGRNRLVRRIFEHFDLKVTRLIRYGFGDLRLSSDLKPGDYRQLDGKEIRALKKATKL